MTLASAEQLPVDWEHEKRPIRIRLLDHMKDLRWHPNKELTERFGHFKARIGELGKMGYRFESRSLSDAARGKEYRLESGIPGLPGKRRRVRLYIDEHDARMLLDGIVSEQTRCEVNSALDSRATQDELRAQGKLKR